MDIGSQNYQLRPCDEVQQGFSPCQSSYISNFLLLFPPLPPPYIYKVSYVVAVDYKVQSMS